MCGGVVDPDYECEPGDMGSTGPCTNACRFPIFVEDFEAGAPQFALAADAELPANLAGLLRVEAGWEIDLSDRWMQISEYTPPMGAVPVAGGIAVAVSDTITVPPLPPSARWELRFRHRFLAEPPDSCGMGQSLLTDGGSLVVWVEGDNERAFFLLENADGSALPLLVERDPAECETTYGVPPNPLEGEPAFTGQELGRGASQLADAAFVLPLEAGDEEIHVLFVMSYDCGNCWEAMTNLVEPGWRIDDVSVAAYREP
jgi:hypothetical protein